MAIDLRGLMFIFIGLMLQITLAGPKEDSGGKEIGPKEDSGGKEIGFEALCPKELIVAEVGKGVVVSLRLEPPISAKNMEIQFTHGDKLIHRYKDGADNSSNQDPQFKGRTFLATDGIWEGRLDFLIHNVGPADNGSYMFYSRSKSFHNDCIFNINVSEPLLQSQSCLPAWCIVAVLVTVLMIVLDVVLVAVYLIHNKRKPKEAAVAEQEGEQLLMKPVMDPQTQNQNNHAVVEMSDLHRGMEAAVAEQEEAAVDEQEGKKLLMESVMDPQTQNQNNHAGPFSEADILLDNSNASSKLWVFDDRKTVKVKNNGPAANNSDNESRADWFVLGCDGFTDRKHRWEVEVGHSESWAVGIAVESVSCGSLSRLAPDEGVWAVGRTADQYQAFTRPVTPLSLKERLEKLVVYLDVNGGQLSFYDFDTKQHIYSHMWQYTEKVFPFIWTMDPDHAITVCSPAATRHSKESE